MNNNRTYIRVAGQREILWNGSVDAAILKAQEMSMVVSAPVNVLAPKGFLGWGRRSVALFIGGNNLNKSLSVGW